MKSVTQILMALIFSAAAATLVPAQDPVKAAPQSYKLQFENDLVKVLRVNYAARSKVPVHDHSKSPAAYVYLTDAGPINFKHAHWDDPVLTRPAVKAGSFRLSPTRFGDETHEVENPGSQASSFLRIEFKYLPIAKTSVSGRFPREAFAANRGLSKVHFDSEHLRVTRHILMNGEDLKVAAGAAEPVLLVVVFAEKNEMSPGETMWLGPGQQKEVTNRSGAPLELLRFDLKKIR